MGNNYTGHNYIIYNYIRHGYIGHACIDRSYTGHKCMCPNCWTSCEEDVDAPLAVDKAEPPRAAAAHDHHLALGALEGIDRRDLNLYNYGLCSYGLCSDGRQLWPAHMAPWKASTVDT